MKSSLPGGFLTTTARQNFCYETAKGWLSRQDQKSGNDANSFSHACSHAARGCARESAPFFPAEKLEPTHVGCYKKLGIRFAALVAHCAAFSACVPRGRLYTVAP